MTSLPTSWQEQQAADGSGQISGEQFVDECQVESDLELLLPATYVTGSSERMLLYRELDSLVLDKDVDAFRARLEDRFGPVPPETEELLRIVPLRRLAARLGAEKVFLKGGRMTLFFVSNPDSPYYQPRQPLLSEPGLRQGHRLYDEVHPPLRPARAER